MVDRAARSLDVAAVLFDLDGTLADTAGDLAGAVNRMREQRGLPPESVESMRPHASSGARGLLQAGLGVATDAPDYLALRDEFLDHYIECLAETTELFPGVPELLDQLEARGVRWGIVTNKATRFTSLVVAALGLDRRAATIVSGDTTPYPKPRPEPLLHAATEISVPPAQCLYVGDDLRDVLAGNAAGMATLIAHWGYLGCTEPPDQWPATGGADEPLDVLAWLPEKV